MAHARILTMSWDDGHPADLRVGELMASYGIRGTFYVPMTNAEGLPVLSATELRHLASMHEVGSHTLTHCRLDRVSPPQAAREVLDGKHALEDVLGHSVAGFCYPSGYFKRNVVSLVRQAGFHYARGIANMRTDLEFDRYMMPTTLQVYPHSRSVYVRNFIRRGHWPRRAALLGSLIRGGPLLCRLIDCLDRARYGTEPSAVHFWGHSWELDGIDGWRVLGEFFRFVIDQPDIILLQNGELGAKAGC